jgi:fructokinase
VEGNARDKRKIIGANRAYTGITLNNFLKNVKVSNTVVKYPVVCFGEILWDILPTGTVPGGAPMNVAYHLKKLGIEPALITRVGADDWGKNLVKLMKQNNISRDFFQLDPTLETGKVTATINPNNEVTYDIVKPVAWDALQWEDGFEKLVADADYFVFGSLATRSEITRNTLLKLLDIAKFRVLDINLRAPHYNRRIIEQLLCKVDLLKLNQSELELITGWFTKYQSDIDRIEVLQDKFSIPNIVVTKGSEGSLFNCKGTVYSHPGYKVTVADTVGSGDSFLAALLTKLSSGAAPADALRFASATGALIASYNGACPDYHAEEIDDFIKTNTVQYFN